MLRRLISVAATIAAGAGAGAALAGDATPGSPLALRPTVTLHLDDVFADPFSTEAHASELEAALPFAGLPKFRLGASARIDPSRYADVTGALSRSCAADICERIARGAALHVGADDMRVSIGAKARIADELDSLLPSGSPSKWYLFIAADAQAMSWSFHGRDDYGLEDPSHVNLNDMRILGDAQAGIGARIAGGDLALGFVTREVSHMGASRQESWIGVTYGWEG